ncbi:MAG: lipopolysaccharide biosynthesis protein [Thermoguttaceae bacterium]|jgi:O-antigen/teichoic acid export membrane protein
MSVDDPQGAGHLIPLDGQSPLDALGEMRTDTLADSVFLLLALTVFQRFVGFLREIVFCRWLDAEQLGQWDMAFGFLMLAAPLAVISLPGTFGRYVERYRQLGQLPLFLRRTAIFCTAMAIPAMLSLYAAPRWFSQLIYGTAQRGDMVMILGGSLCCVIVFNYFISLFTALRNMRLVSGMEMANSFLFAVLAIGLMSAWECTARSVLLAYAGACALTSLAGAWRLKQAWHTLSSRPAPGPAGELWSRLIPFAVWLMAINLLTNMFDLADRTMIVHFSPGSAADALVEVGNYRSSRVMPLLLASIAAMIANAATPHLSHDWEAGRPKRVAQRLNLLLRVVSVALTAGGVLVLWLAPLLFQLGFRGKFAGGLTVLPWTLCYCAWFGLSMVAQKYLWCAEKTGLAGLALLIGLMVNVALNCTLLPRLGLQGAVLATAAANLVTLLLIAWMSSRLGCRFAWSTWTMLLLPGVIPLGPWIASLMLLLIGVLVLGSDRLLTAAEKSELFAGAMRYVKWLPGMAGG